MTQLKVMSAVTLILACAALRVAGQETWTVQDGVYSTAQAERGDKLFGSICAECHQPDEFSTNGYMESWSGASVSELFDLIQATMPEDNPGSLRDQEYAAVIAYLFSLNGLPTGEEDMKGEFASLGQIRIEGPFTEGGQ